MGVTGHVIHKAGSRAVSVGSESIVGVGMIVSVEEGIGAGTKVCVATEIVVGVSVAEGSDAGMQEVRKQARIKTFIVCNRIPASSLHREQQCRCARLDRN